MYTFIYTGLQIPGSTSINMMITPTEWPTDHAYLISDVWARDLDICTLLLLYRSMED